MQQRLPFLILTITLCTPQLYINNLKNLPYTELVLTGTYYKHQNPYLKVLKKENYLKF